MSERWASECAAFTSAQQVRKYMRDRSVAKRQQDAVVIFLESRAH